MFSSSAAHKPGPGGSRTTKPKRLLPGLLLVCATVTVLLWNTPGKVHPRVDTSRDDASLEFRPSGVRSALWEGQNVDARFVDVMQDPAPGGGGGGNGFMAHADQPRGMDVWSPETVFAQQEWGRMKCLRNVQERIRNMSRPLFEKYPGKVALVDVAFHANLGDNILWRGAVSLLAGFGLSPALVCYSSQPGWTDNIDKRIQECKAEDIIEVVKDRGLVLFHAGGNWGDLYRSVQNGRLKLLKELSKSAQTNGFGILQLPQDIMYLNHSYVATDQAVVKELGADVFTLFVRAQESLTDAQSMYPDTPVQLCPDVAFVLGPLLPTKRASVDVLILFRQDKETSEDIWALTNWMESTFQLAGLTYHFQDWWYHPDEHLNEISENSVTAFSEVRLQAAMDVVSMGRVVVTNRLHGSVVANLMGKHLIVVDTKGGKLKKVRDVAFASSADCSSQNLHTRHSDSLKSAMESAIDFLQAEGDSLVHN